MVTMEKTMGKTRPGIHGTPDAEPMKPDEREKPPISLYLQAARSTMAKTKRVNIRLSTSDLVDIQNRALREGLPYQTLMSSILHKYASGQLHESKE
jgi:predicted DNA binding CopG/RHH family protein